MALRRSAVRIPRLQSNPTVAWRGFCSKVLGMRTGKILLLVLFLLGANLGLASASTLPFGVVFKGRDKFDRLVALAREGNWKTLRIGERTATIGRALVG